MACVDLLPSYISLMAASGFAANYPPDTNILNALAEINTALDAIRVDQVAADLRLGTIQQGQQHLQELRKQLQHDFQELHRDVQNVGRMATTIL